MEFPDRYFCPLNKQIMYQPAQCEDGYNYEKSCIIKYVMDMGHSPITKQPLKHNQIQDNIALKQEIDQVRHLITDENRFRDLKLVAEEENKNDNNNIQVEGSNNQSNSSQLKLQINRFNDQVKISIKTPEGQQRSACDICCVIDVSGSMSDEAKIKNSKGDIESNGLTILDLVKHSVKTIINNLDERDRLSLVAFHTNAYKITDLTPMNENGRNHAIKELEKLIPLDSTNIWDGIYQALEVVKAGQQQSIQKGEQRVAFSQILLFTDGQPNVIPPRGHLPMLKKYKEENDVNCSISTFGFGYNLDSELLDQLAIEGRGSFAFIPDGQFVGTVFVNALSNLMTTLAVDAVLCIENSNGAQFEEVLIEEEQAKNILNKETVLGNYDYQRCSWGLNINIGTLQYGQSKDIVVTMKNVNNNSNKPYITATLKYRTSSTHKQPEEISASSSDISQQENEVMVDVFRLESVEAIRKAMTLFKTGNRGESQNIIKQHINNISSHQLSKQNKFIQDLVKDLAGQVTEAISVNDYYQKWGRHYLPSLLRAHQIQQCNNFKDPGVQHYGGKLFNQIRDKADEAFLKIPPPKPSIKKQGQAPKSVNMASYYNNSAPCFDGNCLVKMANGDIKKVMDIRKGDLIASPAINGVEAKVSCVVKTPCLNNQAYFVEFEDGLIITPYHPIRVNGIWQFPCQLKPTELRECDFIYSFLLESGHSMEINGIECVTYAHNFQEEIVKHDFFGTEKIITELKKMIGWENGYVTLSTDCMIRDPTTTLVIGLKQNIKNQLSIENIQNYQIIV
ncbi:von willebrand factor type A domain protein, putative (macronuclear) [Tetrahymena thermophila SB210]|uniref:von willebrand factor type A domain protein, putative n=1 Tax=Tetrahymena thermophila (strain SB210) TaxID=312017 RepID=I7M701_TETTS|nr:von willebrand factor type A domain protein, putative [Tetrahymena thermophila SB210]EAR87575.1 von willebrand factor type A domain protein, putative [Tetrahymena thermophila SB210]|eukprot:XP_001007820.1 von willebrand factor type A domain protein, putative [Tetrahymena thermophila SB210]